MAKKTTVPVGDSEFEIRDDGVPVVHVDLIQELWTLNGVLALSMSAAVADGRHHATTTPVAHTQVRVRMPINSARNLAEKILAVLNAEERKKAN